MPASVAAFLALAVRAPSELSSQSHPAVRPALAWRAAEIELAFVECYSDLGVRWFGSAAVVWRL
eukprot:15442824-Alexandrium_andersonii.AAC.1